MINNFNIMDNLKLWVINVSALSISFTPIVDVLKIIALLVATAYSAIQLYDYIKNRP